jgi:single-stranded-DNA-specific exonuclease
MAAGLEIRRERLDAFRTGFGEAAAATLRGRDLRPVQRVDAWLDLADVDDALADALEAMRPFGCGNPTPVFACSGVRVVGRPRAVGQDGQHLKMTLAAGGAQRGAIAFGMAARELPDGPLDLAFQVRKEVYQGREQLTLMVQDWRGQAGSPAGPA